MRARRFGLVLGVFAALGCRSQQDRGPDPSASPPPASSLALEAVLRPAASAAPRAADVAAFEKRLQQTKLRPPARRVHHARLAFGRGALAQLGDDALRIFADPGPRLLLTEPVEGPRAVLRLPDGSLLAADARRLLRWEPGWKQVKSSPRPMLLPDFELYADAVRSDWLWVFEPGHGGSPSRLNGYSLSKLEELVPTPEQTIELGAAGGVLGLTREGVWLYVTEGHVSRFAPAGGRLPSLAFEPSSVSRPDWVLPASRVDQSSWLSEGGELWRMQVSPSFQRLSKTTLSGSVFAVDVGDQGRLNALVVVTGDGPRFELALLDAQLRPSGRALLTAEAPTGDEDWVQVVTANQQVVVDPGRPRVAVGGPGRATIFDASAKVIFSIPSR